MKRLGAAVPRRVACAVSCTALALLTFFQFPGHTWLQQDTQIYVPILEHLRDPAVLRNDILVQHPHVAFTLYDETALALRAVTRAGFREVLAAQQLITRALGIWGLLLMAEALGLTFAPALLVAAICSLGALISGPAVLTFEYEPTPRAFAVPLLICALGLAAQRRYIAVGIAASAAFLYHPPTALPFWAVYFVFAVWPKGDLREAHAGVEHVDRRAFVASPDYERGERLLAFVPLVAAASLLWIAARNQSASGDAQRLWERLDSSQEFLQRMRTAYVWVSTWPAAIIAHHLLILVVVIAAFLRIRHTVNVEVRTLLLGLAALGVLTMPLSWVLLEEFHWGLVPQVQPLRALLFLTLAMQFLTAAAGARAMLTRRTPEACGWLFLAYLLPLQPLLTGPFVWNRVALAVASAAVTAFVGVRLAPIVALAAFFAIPLLGGVVNYPRLHTADLAQLSAWARANTPRDAVFVFPQVKRGLAPGVFRTEALRAVYVDWKGGGQVNYLKDLGEQWWFRWRLIGDFQPSALPQYAAMGISYAVLQEPLAAPPQFQNATYFVYRLK